MEADVEKMKAATIGQAYDMLYRQAATERMRKETTLLGEGEATVPITVGGRTFNVTPERALTHMEGRSKLVTVDGMELPASTVFNYLNKQADLVDVTVDGQTLRVTPGQALGYLGEEGRRVEINTGGRILKVSPEAAAAHERAQEQFGLAVTREERAERTEKLNAATKRINVLLKKYGEPGAISFTEAGGWSIGMGDNAFAALVAKARAKDRDAMADLRSVARDMYSVRAPKGLLPKTLFPESVLDELKKGETLTLEDPDGVFLKLRMDPSGMIKIVEIIG